MTKRKGIVRANHFRNRFASAFGLALALGATAVVPPTAVLAQAPPAPNAAPSVPDRVAAMKQALARSNANLKDYEWIETTVVSLKGDEKSRTQQRCYHGADGRVQKVPIAAAPAPKKKRGIRGKIVENKKEELSDYMKQAIGLVHQYLPPNPELVQRAKDAGKVSLAVLEPGKRVRLDFKDYLIPGDALTVGMNTADDRLGAVGVSTFLGKKDPVTLDVRMGTLEDGTTYPAETNLQAKSKGVGVVVTNSGYRKTGK